MNNHLPAAVAESARRAAAKLVDELSGVRSVVVATADGFDVAHAGSASVDPARLAAMVSSFAAVGEAASRETGIGAPRCLVIESTEGRLVIRCVEVLGHALVIVILSDKATLLGMVWNTLASIERSMVAA